MSSISLPLLQDQNMAPSVKVVLNFITSTGTIFQRCLQFDCFYYKVKIWHKLSKLSSISQLLQQSQNLAQSVKIVFNFTAPTTKSKSGTICQNCPQYYHNCLLITQEPLKSPGQCSDLRKMKTPFF